MVGVEINLLNNLSLTGNVHELENGEKLHSSSPFLPLLLPTINQWVIQFIADSWHTAAGKNSAAVTCPISGLLSSSTIILIAGFMRFLSSHSGHELFSTQTHQDRCNSTERPTLVITALTTATATANNSETKDVYEEKPPSPVATKWSWQLA